MSQLTTFAFFFMASLTISLPIRPPPPITITTLFVSMVLKFKFWQLTILLAARIFINYARRANPPWQTGPSRMSTILLSATALAIIAKTSSQAAR